MNMIVRALAPIFALLCLAALPVSAQSLRVNDIVRAEILPGWQTERGTRMVALHLTMAPGWHTYWRTPGDSGIAPRFDWSRSQNLASVRVLWPRPQVFEDAGLVSYGFENELILPIEITPRDPARPVAMMGELSLGICDQTCVPADLSVMQALRGAGARDPRITQALAMRPEAGARAGLDRVRCQLSPTERGAELSFEAHFPRLGRDERAIVELPGSGFWVSGGNTERNGNRLSASFRVRGPGNTPVSIDRGSVVFSVLSQDRMITVQGCTGS